MFTTLRQLTEQEWPVLYHLMKLRNFPEVPASFGAAKPSFKKARLFGLHDRLGLQAGFVFGPPQDGIAFFDVVCTAKYAGKWASRGLLKQLYRQAFDSPPHGFGLRALWVQPHGAMALKAALAGGFQPVTPLRGKTKQAQPVLVITPTSVPTKFY